MSDMPTSLTPDVIIFGVEFSDDYQAAIIHYVESRNVAPKAWKKESITVDATMLDDGDMTEVVSKVRDWLDIGLKHIRNEGGKQQQHHD